MKGIPEKYITDLELKDVILEVADDLCNDCHISEYGKHNDPVRVRKYIEMSWPGKGKQIR